MAIAELALLRTAIDDCIASGAAQGEPQLSLAEVVSEADEVLAVDLTVAQGEQVAHGQLVYARVGRRIATMLTLSLDRADLAIGRDALATVVARMRSGG